MGGNVKGKGAAVANLAADLDGAAMVLDDSMHYRQAQPGPFLRRFGGKERVKNAFQCRCIHAVSGVADGKLDVGAGDKIERGAGTLGCGNGCKADLQSTHPPAHGMLGVGA